MTRKILAPLLIVLFGLALACGGGGGSEDSDSISKLAASTSLRIGRSINPVSPIATSAALNNGETLIVIYNPVNGKISEVIFKKGEQVAKSLSKERFFKVQAEEIIRIIVDPSGRPSSAQTNDTTISFSNYTSTSTDVSVQRDGRSVGNFNFPLLEESSNLLQSDQLIANILGVGQSDEDAQRGFLSSGVVAVRTAGCAGQSASQRFDTSQNFSILSQAACNSQLIDEVSKVARDEDVKIEEISVTDIPDNGSCNSTGSVAAATGCVQNFGEKLVDSSEEGRVGAFPTPTPRPTPRPSITQSPTPSPTTIPSSTPSSTPTATPTPTPITNPLLGRWEGPATQNFQTTFCRDGDISFVTIPDGDILCRTRLCLLTGTVTSKDFAGTEVVSPISGTLDKDGRIAFGGNGEEFGQPTRTQAEGKLEQKTAGFSGDGTFENNRGCQGTFVLTKKTQNAITR